MKIKRFRKLLLATMACVCFCCAVCAVMFSTVKVSAADTASWKDSVSSFTMETGARVRSDGENSGLRFVASMSEAEYQAFSANNADATISYGVIIAPYDYVTDINKGELTEENIFGASAKYCLGDSATCECGKVHLANVKTHLMHVSEEAFYDGKYILNGSLIQIKSENIHRPFVGVAYIEYKTESATEYKFATYADNEIANNVRSMLYVAQVNYNDQSTSQDDKTILNDMYLKDYLDRECSYTVNYTLKGANGDTLATDSETKKATFNSTVSAPDYAGEVADFADAFKVEDTTEYVVYADGKTVIEVVYNENIYKGKIKVNAISSADDFVKGVYIDSIANTVGDGTPYNMYQYYNASNYATTKAAYEATTETVGDKQANYKVYTTETWDVGYSRPMFGFNLSLSKQDLINYKKYSGLTQLKIEFYMRPNNNATQVSTRYIDVLTGFNSNGIGQYTRSVFDVNTWFTVTFDIDFIINNYELIANTKLNDDKGNNDGGYCLFVSPNDKDLNSLSANGGAYDNVTAATDCPTSATGGNMGTNWTIWFGEIVFVNPEAELKAIYGGKTSVNAIDDAVDIKPSLGSDTHEFTNGSNYVWHPGGYYNKVTPSAVSDTQISGKDVTYQVAFADLGGLNWSHPGIGFNLSVSKQDLINYKKYSGLTSLSVEIMIDIVRYHGQSHTRYVDVLTGYDASGVGQYTRYDIKDTAWHTFTFDIDFIIDNYDAFTTGTFTHSTFNGGYVLFSFPTAENTTSIPDTVDGTNCSTSVDGKQFGTEYVIYFGQIAFVK